MTVSNGGVCSDAVSTVQAIVKCQPVASGLADAATCSDLPYCFVNDVLQNGTITWSTFGDGTFNFTNAQNPCYTPGPADIALGESGISVGLSVVVVNAPCPSASASMQLLVNPIPKVSVSSSKPTICLGENTVLTANVVQSGTYSYGWSPGSETTQAITAAPTTTTTYSVTVTNTSTGCDDVATSLVTVIQPPKPGNDTTVCIGGTVSLNGALSPGMSGAVWSSSSGGAFSNPSDLNATYIPTLTDSTNGSVTLTLTATGVPCSNLSASIKVTVVPRPQVNAGPDQFVSLGYEVPLDGKIQYATGGTWTTSGCGTFVPDNKTLNAKYVPCDQDYETDKVVLTLTSTGIGCPISSQMVITPEKVNIPNVMTPRPPDGFNDVFSIKGLPIDANVIIYNRWGLKVYEAQPYLNDWDAEGMDEGVYYYVITYKAKKWTGFIHVLAGAN
jgi:hypothetical protein